MFKEVKKISVRKKMKRTGMWDSVVGGKKRLCISIDLAAGR